MFDAPSQEKEGPKSGVEYQALCKYQPGPFKVESKVTKFKLP